MREGAGNERKNLAGSSGAAAGIRDTVIRFSGEREPVLLTGETGVGKNYIAGLLHRYSGKSGKLVTVDTPNIIDNLFESKLFGHKKGAFTDAKFDKAGFVEEAENGTLLFDEIGEVPPDVQAKLLHFIDTGTYYTLGDSVEKEAKVRIIAATNRDLRQAVENREFREDLYFRLNVLEIEIPPLRRRNGDIKKLVLENKDLLRGKEMGGGFWDVLQGYHWPGNVRELLNILRRAGIMLDSPITGKKMASLIHGGGNGKKPPPGQNGNKESRVIERIRENLKTGDSFWQLVWEPFIGRDMDRCTVKLVLKQFYAESSFNFRQMIKNLNMAVSDYPKFMSLVYKYKIDPRI